MAELKFSIGVDDSKVEQAVQRMRQQFETISRNAVTSGKSIDDVVKRMVTAFEDGIDEFSTMSEQLEFQKQVVKDLGSELDKLGESLKEVTPSGEWETVDKSLQEAKQALVEWNEALAESEQEAMAADNANESLRSQLRKMQKELVDMEAAGKRGTREFRELQEQAGKLQDAIDDANKQMRIMANDQRGFQGIISGLSGISGAMSAAMGVMGMFTDENEKMQKVMLKVQSLMSITVGLQQLQATLDKDSAFRLVTLNGLKEWWAKVTTQAAAAQTAENAAVATSGVVATGAAGGFKLLGAAIKSIPGLGWLLAAVSALGTIIALVVKRLGKEKELTGEMQRQKKLLDEIADAKSAAAKATQKDADALVIARDRLKTLQEGSSEWKRTVKDIADIIGVQADGLEKNIDKVRTLTDAYIKMKMAEKLGDEYLTRATNIKVDTEDVISKIGRLGKKDSDQAEELLSGLGLLSDGEIKRYIKAWKKSITDGSGEALAAYHDQQEWLRRQVGYEANKYVKLYEEQAKQLGRASLTFENYNNSEEQRRNNQESAKKAAENQRARIEAAKKAAEEAGKELMEIETSMQKEKDDKAIDIMNEGFKKRAAQIDKEYNEEQRRIGELGGRMLALNNEIAKNEAAALGKSFKEMTSLTPEQQSLIDTLLDYAFKDYQKKSNDLKAEQKKQFDDMIGEFETYLQKRQRILDEYASKEESFYNHDENGQRTTMKEGVTQGNVDELNKQRDEAIASVDMEFAQRSDTFNSWLNEISSMTLSQLRKLLESAKNTLKTLESNKNADPQKLAEARAAVNALDKAIRNAELAPDNEKIKEWQMLSDELNNAGGAFRSLGEDIEGVMGDTLKLVGTLMQTTSDIVKNITQVTEQGLTAMQQASETAAKAIKAASMSVAILAIIQAIYSAVVQLRDFIDNNFNTESGFGKFASDFLHFITDSETMLENMAWALLGPIGTVVGMLTSDNSHSKREQHKRDIEAIISNYENLGKELDVLKGKIDKLFGQDVVENKKQQIELLQQQVKDLEAAIAEEKKMKNPDQNQISQWEDSIEELNNEIESLGESLYDSIFGEDITSAIRNFADALTDAWSSGASASEAANRYMQNMIKQTALQAILQYTQASQRIEEIRAKLQEYLENDGIISDNEQEELQNMAQELMDDVREKFEWAERLFQDDSIAATSRGFAQASQESIDELNGRFTVIQSHTMQLLDNSLETRLNVTSIASLVDSINNNTFGILTTVDKIYNDVRIIRQNM